MEFDVHHDKNLLIRYLMRQCSFSTSSLTDRSVCWVHHTSYFGCFLLIPQVLHHQRHTTSLQNNSDAKILVGFFVHNWHAGA
jgi:hypothetical protein